MENPQLKNRYILVTVACFAIGSIGVYLLEGPIAFPFTSFYYLAVLTAAVHLGLSSALGVALVSSLFSLPAIMDSPLLESNSAYALYSILHVGLPSGFAFFAYALVYRYKMQRKELKSLYETQVRITRTLDEELTRLHMTYQLSQQIQTHLSVGKIGEVVLNALLTIVNAKACSVWVYKEDEKMLSCIGASGSVDMDWRRVKIKPGEGIAGTAFQEKKIIRIDDVSDSSLWKNILHRHGKFSSALGVPLMVQDRVLGALSVLDKKDGTSFTLADEKLISLLATQIATSLENAFLYEELKGHLARVSSMLEVAQNLIQVVDLQKLFHVIIENALRICGGDAGYLLLLNEEDNLEPKAFVNILPGFAETLKMRRGEGISGKVLEAGKTLAVTSLEELLSLRHREIHWVDISSAVWIPLLLGNEAQGVMCIYRTRARKPFEEEDISLLETLAGLAVLAIEKNRLYEDLLKMNERAVQALGMALDAFEPSHSKKQKCSASLAREFAKALGLNEKEKQALEFAAHLYDIGKIGIPEAILNKKDPLTEEERRIIQRHVHISADIVSSVEQFKDIVPYVFLHHERIDGTGYPLGLKGKEIPLGAKILSVIDAYVAMRQERPYRPALDHETALMEIKRKAGVWYDPEIVNTLEQILQANGILEV